MASKHKMKKRLTQSEEFEIMKLVLDKFLWLGFAIMALGFYNVAVHGFEMFIQGFGFLVSGCLILGLAVILLVKEYEVLE
ncbi:MAG: hypothetical protein ACQER9_01520 [Nanobdellota archaeon]